MPPPVAVRAIALIRGEHRAITCMCSALRALVARYLGMGHARSFALCEAILIYLENVPDHVHHPHLTEEAWQRIEHAFSDDADPPFGMQLADDYRHLYECIAEMMPTALRPHLAGGLVPPLGA